MPKRKFWSKLRFYSWYISALANTVSALGPHHQILFRVICGAFNKFPDIFVQAFKNCHRLLKIQYVIAIPEMVKWEVLTHPPYWPDITLSNYQLYRLMAHGLTEQHFHSYEYAKKRLNSWLASKDMLIFQCGIQMLLERWEKVVASRWTIFSVTYYLLIFENKHYFPWKISKNLFKVPIIVDYNC